MEVEFRLKQLLAQIGRDSRGVIKEIADGSGLHRHTVRKMYNNQLSRPSLDTIASVAKWLEDNDPTGKLAAGGLPQALIGRRQTDLFTAVAAPGHVALYLGDFEEEDQPAGTARWVSLHDAEVVSQLVHELTTPDPDSGVRAQVRLAYVPFRVPKEQSTARDAPHAEHVARARALYKELMSPRAHETAILIGSMRVNYLVELLVADVFGDCKEFETPAAPEVPFWLTYRANTKAIPSCFGSTKNPPELGHRDAPGVYYLESDRPTRWAYCEWTRKERDAGIVLTVRDPGTNALVLAAFGFSGYGTEALGKHLIGHASEFWKHEVAGSTYRVGVYICRLHLAETTTARGDRKIVVKEAKVVPMDPKVLKRRLR